MVLILALASGLAGCAVLDPDSAPSSGERAEDAKPVTDPEPVKRPAELDPTDEAVQDPDQVDADKGGGDDAVTLPPDFAALPDAPKSPDFRSLIGLEFAGVEGLLGEADRVIDTPPGRVWRYGDRACNLKVRFYPDLETLTFRVLSYELEVHEDDANIDSGDQPDDEPGPAWERCRDRIAERFRARS